jgi:SpoIID/LytB domain protein
MRGRVLIRAVVLATLVASACTAEGDGGTTSRTPAQSGSQPASPATGTPAPTQPRTLVRVVPPPEGTFLVRGRYPFAPSGCVDPERPRLVARYPGAVRVRRAEDGTLSLAVTVPFERYLEGIAEVPPSWPVAALEAQAIAARSYALATTGWSGEEGATLDEPICATAACQVYRGIPVPPDPTHRRWVRAVRSTRGEVLLHDGRPATTVYFSTSNGQTYGNEDVFGSDPLPYLRPVVERDDGASTTSRWRVEIPFRDLSRFLHAAGAWPGGATIAAADPRADELLVRGGGERRSIALDDLRDAVNTWAPCRAPERYPGALPLTIPSRWLEISAGGNAIVVEGRGWGHGAGMVQWGAYGKARRGLSAEEILAFYYGGLTPQPYPEPGLIHVQVASGLSQLTILPSSAGARLDGDRLGPGPIVIGGGETLDVET